MKLLIWNNTETCYLCCVSAWKSIHFWNKWWPYWKQYFDIKGQIIFKGLFGVLEFSQKTNERIRRSSKNEFVRSFFGRIWGYQKSFWNNLTFSINFSFFQFQKMSKKNLRKVESDLKYLSKTTVTISGILSSIDVLSDFIQAQWSKMKKKKLFKISAFSQYRLNQKKVLFQ